MLGLSSRRNALNASKVAGAWISYCIGSGFATGQDSLQYFCSWGSYAFIAIALGIMIHIYVSSSYLRLGVEQQFDNPMSVFDYYCGPYIGKAIAAITLIVSFGSPAVMIAGFGATLYQHFGISPVIGNIALGLACFMTIVLGVKRIVDIIGSIGPMLIIATLFTGGVYLITHIDKVQAGMALAPTLNIQSIGNSWVMSGVFFATWAPLSCAPFLVATAKTIDTKQEALWGSVVGNIFYGLATAMLVAAFYCDIEEIMKQMIPNLYLANQLSSIFSMFFFVLIILGIYSSAVPGLFVVCATLAREHTTKYYITAAIVCAAATIVTLVLPFDKLLNLVYSVFGYMGLPFVGVILIKQIYIYLSHKNKA
ncbi:MAG: hypothetical protein Q4D58_10665 [Synergistaceae bacterium]|nr:hypothetical protein [Synergistaceae bacterium]